MFNQLTPSDIVGAIGTTLRTAGRSTEPASDFERDQLMSAFSATRHLAVELESFAPELDRFRHAVAQRVLAAQNGGAQELAAVAERLEADGSPATIGAAVGDLLARLRDDDAAWAVQLRTDVRGLLRELADREVDLLADGL